MTEQELRERLGADIELPAIVDDRMVVAYAQIRGKDKNMGKRKSVRRLRTLLVIAAVVAVLGVGAIGIHLVTRAEVPLPGTAPVLEGMFGNESRTSTRGQTWTDGVKGITYPFPDSARVPVDEQAAEALVGPYLPEVGYTWQIGAYIFTVESYLFDEGSGTGRIYYTLEHPGILEDVIIFPQNDQLAYYRDESDFRGISMPNAGERTYVDRGRTTDDKLCLALSFTYWNWDLEDRTALDAGAGVTLEFLSKVDENGKRLTGAEAIATMALPGLPSLPYRQAYNAAGEVKAVFSAIGMKLVHIDLAEGETDTREISLQYADGTEYVVESFSNNIENYDYACRSDHAGESFQICFNRLVDPAQVVSVTVDGHAYAVKH